MDVEMADSGDTWPSEQCKWPGTPREQKSILLISIYEIGTGDWYTFRQLPRSVGCMPIVLRRKGVCEIVFAIFEGLGIPAAPIRQTFPCSCGESSETNLSPNRNSCNIMLYALLVSRCRSHGFAHILRRFRFFFAAQTAEQATSISSSSSISIRARSSRVSREWENDQIGVQTFTLHF